MTRGDLFSEEDDFDQRHQIPEFTDRTGTDAPLTSPGPGRRRIKSPKPPKVVELPMFGSGVASFDGASDLTKRQFSNGGGDMTTLIGGVFRWVPILAQSNGGTNC